MRSEISQGWAGLSSGPSRRDPLPGHPEGWARAANRVRGLGIPHSGAVRGKRGSGGSPNSKPGTVGGRGAGTPQRGREEDRGGRGSPGTARGIGVGAVPQLTRQLLVHEPATRWARLSTGGWGRAKRPPALSPHDTAANRAPPAAMTPARAVHAGTPASTGPRRPGPRFPPHPARVPSPPGRAPAQLRPSPGAPRPTFSALAGALCSWRWQPPTRLCRSPRS